MRLLFYSSYYHPYLSGLTSYPKVLLSHLASNHKITLLTFKHDPELLSEESVDGVRVLRMPFWFTLSKGFISPQSVWYFIRFLRQTDLVFINLPNAEALPLVILARLYGKPVLSLYHCQVTLGPSLPERLISSILNGIVQLEMNFSHRIIAYTKDYVASIKSFTHLTPKITYILPPVPVTPPDKTVLNKLISQKQKSIWLGFSGRLAREKGLDVLLDAYGKLSDKDRYQLIFAGPSGNEVVGEGSYTSHLKTRLEKENIPHLFLGTLKGGTLAAFYQAIDVLILPSVNQTEAFGMVQVEAMLSGTPVIATNLPGVRQPIRLTGMGEIVPIGDSDALAQAITKVCTHPEPYTQTSMKSKARQIFNPDNTFAAYDKILTSL